MVGAMRGCPGGEERINVNVERKEGKWRQREPSSLARLNKPLLFLVLFIYFIFIVDPSSDSSIVNPLNPVHPKSHRRIHGRIQWSHRIPWHPCVYYTVQYVHYLVAKVFVM